MRGKLDVETLLKVVLLLVAVLLVLEVVQEFVGTLAALLGPIPELLALLVLILIVLWLVGRL